MRGGQSVVDRPDHIARELVADGEHEFQVGNSLPGLPGRSGQRREREAAVVLRQSEIPAGGVVQPGHARRDILARADPEVSGQRLRQNLVRLAGGQCLEVALALLVGAGPREHGRERDERGSVSARPAGRDLERLDVVVLDDLP